MNFDLPSRATFCITYQHYTAPCQMIIRVMFAIVCRAISTLSLAHNRSLHHCSGFHLIVRTVRPVSRHVFATARNKIKSLEEA
ncbi:hypothetical protein IF2G_03968 [Cordyceps javanica]|nr:hypothetical protein IF2G_03968 [Cordyceps javanica]